MPLARSTVQRPPMFLPSFYRELVVISTVTLKLAVLILPGIFRCDGLHDIPMLSYLAILYSPEIIEGCGSAAKRSFAFSVSPVANVLMSASAFSLFVMIVSSYEFLICFDVTIVVSSDGANIVSL